MVKSIKDAVFGTGLLKLQSWLRVLQCDRVWSKLSSAVSSDLPGVGVALGALHAAPLSASAHRLELHPALLRKVQLQPGPGE